MHSIHGGGGIVLLLVFVFLLLWKEARQRAFRVIVFLWCPGLQRLWNQADMVAIPVLPDPVCVTQSKCLASPLALYFLLSETCDRSHLTESLPDNGPG